MRVVDVPLHHELGEPPVEVEEVQIEVDVPNNPTSSPLSDVNLCVRRLRVGPVVPARNRVIYEGHGGVPARLRLGNFL